MSQFSQQSSKNVCVITNGDSFMGYALCYRFLQAMQNKDQDWQFANYKMRVLCRHRSGYGLSKLEEMGAEICEVNYEDENKLREIFKDVKYMTFVPEHSSNRVKEAKNLLHAACHQGVEHVGMLSIVGVDRLREKNELWNSHEYKNLKQYCEIEHLLKDTFKDKYCIIRAAKFYQLLYYLAPQMEGKNILPSPVKKDKKWVMVNINDVVEGIFRLYKKEKEQLFREQRTWNFVGFKPMKTEDMAKQIGEGLGQRDLKLEHMSGNELKKELERVQQDDRFNKRPEETKFRRDRDGYWSFPIAKYLNSNCMEMMMEYWELANSGELEIESNDLKKALDDEPMTLRKYFENNRNQFQRFK